MSEHKFTNQLQNESSPYLLQHAHNPVDWHPWSAEAFARARAENKPILLSVGYSACHWCHVMERESFEDEKIAQLMNEHFINIKVDREERPDVDQIYMNAVQMMTGRGGWPMTVFLTPDGVPFYGGTYYPPTDRHGMPGFPRILLSISDAYREKQAEIAESSTSLLAELNRMNAVAENFGQLAPDIFDAAFDALKRTYDRREGGFGNAPKFPPAMTLEFLLRYHARTRREEALEMVEHTAVKMANGGMYDQLGGGFHRYSVDAKWLVPHFEKMLYDNALLARLYLHLFQATKTEFYRHIAAEILDYVAREMTDASGGFYSSQDADSEGVEGKFFVWTLAEVEEILGAEDAALVCAYYDVAEEGNFEEQNILHVTRSAAEVAQVKGVTLERLNEALEHAWRELFAARERRIKPFRDEKVLTAWNGLMLSAFAEAAAILERKDFLDIARGNAEFILREMRGADGLLLRTWKDGAAKLNAYIEDYAFYAEGLIALYETTGEMRWLTEAQSLTETMLAEFWDNDAGGFWFTGKSHEELIVRSKDYFDNATPSGNSVAVIVLLKLAVFFEREDYRRQALTILQTMHDTLLRYPSGFGRLLSGLDFYLSQPKEIALIGANDAEQTQALLRAVWSMYLPNKVIARSASDEADAGMPLLKNRAMLNGQPTAYVCENYVCREPVTDAEQLLELLGTSVATANF